MSKNNDIIFIRKNGRIIPIRKKTRDDIKEAVGYSVAGGSISALAGRLYSRNLKRAEKMHQMSFDFGMDKPFSKLPKGVKSAGEGMVKATNKLRASKNFMIGGQIIGGSLLSLGVQRGLRAIGFNDDDLAVKAGAEVGSQMASAIIVDQAKRGFGIATKFKVPAPVKRVAGDLATRFIKKQLRFKF